MEALANEQLATGELCGAPLKSRPGEVCQGPAVKDGRCIRHVPAAIASRPAATQKARHTRRQQSLKSPDSANAEPEVRLRAHSPSMASVEKLASDEGAPPWVRWVAGQMAERGIDRQQLVALLNWSRKSVYNALSLSNDGPANSTIQRFEDLFGPLPTEAWRAIKNARSAKAGGKRSQQRLRKRAEKWARPRLRQEVLDLGGQSLLDEVNQIFDGLPWDKPLGIDAYKIYLIAKAANMRRHRKPAFPESAQGAPGPRSPKGQLALTLHGLERREGSRFYQCQNCGQIWMKQAQRHRGRLCGPCWREYLPLFNSWQMAGRVGTPPKLPRRRGGRLITSDALQKRIISFLRFRVLGDGPESDMIDEYKELSATKRLVEESTHSWCQRAVRRLAQLP